jgi:hypothetical protein
MIKGDFWDMEKELIKIKQSLLDDIESYGKVYSDIENYEKFKKEIETVQAKEYCFAIRFNYVFLAICIITTIADIFEQDYSGIVISVIGYWFFHRNMKQRAKKAYGEYENIEKYLQKQILRAQRERQVIG